MPSLNLADAKEERIDMKATYLGPPSHIIQLRLEIVAFFVHFLQHRQLRLDPL